MIEHSIEWHFIDMNLYRKKIERDTEIVKLSGVNAMAVPAHGASAHFQIDVSTNENKTNGIFYHKILSDLLVILMLIHLEMRRIPRNSVASALIVIVIVFAFPLFCRLYSFVFNIDIINQ